MSKRAVVIGSGFGGLSIAVRLQARGMQVTLLEKREKVGGRAYQFKEKGYTFDMGPSLITAPDIIESVFRAAGKKREDYFPIIPLDPYYRIYFHDKTYIDYNGDTEQMKSQMAKFNKQDAANYERFMKDIKPIHETVIEEGFGAKPFNTMGSMVSFVPRVVKLGAYWPVHTFVKKYFKDFRHRFMFSFHPLFIGGNPFAIPSIYLMIPYLEKEGGVWFSPGGMYTFVEALEKVFKELGGEIHTSCPATKIGVENGKVTGVEAGGQFFDADIVVSNADTAWTYKNLVAAEHRKRWTDKKLEKLSYTMSCYLLYIGVKKKYPGLKHHTLILSERYKELVKDIFKNKVVPDDFSMYLHIPTATDPSMAPEGGESMYVLIPVANLRAGIDWEEFEPKFTDKVIDFLEDWGLDDLREHIEVQRVFTPNNFKKELFAYVGNAFGIEPKLSQTAYFRPHNRSEDIEGLYLVGASTHPGAGVPGVLLSAETTEHCIVEDLGTALAPTGT
ncbi:MAG: phytoene dehydrogenase [Deltaproteobacteria bacterium]|nr:phytoene dehydrogenase [Deltaproteobacteria bacterium]MBU48466.1 phytoene dehydrogenase [Deltaproteobacteria bacterium]|tara:strand:+ start:1027 stop:2529 length:1503 start_codon:yes stop_codon:yes gene_type:complete